MGLVLLSVQPVRAPGHTASCLLLSHVCLGYLTTQTQFITKTSTISTHVVSRRVVTSTSALGKDSQGHVRESSVRTTAQARHSLSESYASPGDSDSTAALK